MEKFTYSNPTTIHFGEGQIAAIADAIPTEAKVLVLYGGGSIKSNGVYQQVSNALANHQWDEFSGIEPNPQYDTLIKAVDKVRNEGFDFLLAVGGGSVVDGTKFVAAAARFEQGDPWAILNEQAAVVSAVPMACVLTLPATGSESNAGSVVSRGQDKLFFMSPLVQPKFAVLDPQTTLSLSLHQVANGVVDAYVHVLEQYLTYPVNAKVQDRFAEGLLMTLREEGPQALKNPDDLAVRANIMWSATQALNGLIGVGVPQDWTTHMIGHELTGHFGIDHARTLSIMMPAVLKHARHDKQEKLLQYGERVLGIHEGSVDERIDATIVATEAFFNTMTVPTRLSDVNLDAQAIPAILSSLKAHGMTRLGERGNIQLKEIEEILTLAL